jgi:hypothetical protein
MNFSMSQSVLLASRRQFPGSNCRQDASSTLNE